MTASAANGFGNVVFDPSATTCQVNPYNFHPEFSTSTPQTRNVAAAHTYNVAFSDEIGHFEYCAKVGTDTNSTCLQPLGADTNDGDTAGPDPAGDDDFCLPASASLKVKIGGCLDIDGDFDGVSYNFTWPGSISNPVADRLLNPRSFLFTSPTVHGRNFTSMAFESDISRKRVRRHGLPRGHPVPAARAQPERPEPWHRLREPAAELGLLPLLQHPPGRRNVHVAGRRTLHPWYRQQVRRERARRVRPAAGDLLPDEPVRRRHQAVERLPQEPQHNAVSRDLICGIANQAHPKGVKPRPETTG